MSKKEESTTTEEKQKKKRKNKKEVQEPSTIPEMVVPNQDLMIIEVESQEETLKVACRKCGVENDSDANFCKNCGTKLKRKKTKEDVYPSISKMLQILAIAVALDAMFQVRPHIGTARGDTIIIGYALLLATSLLLSTIFRLLSNKVTPKKVKDNKFKMSRITTQEAKLIIGVYLLALILFIYSNSRMVFLRPGNNYIERRVGEYVKRWDDVSSYTRTGVRKCPRVNWYFKYLPNYTFFCYEYTYSIKFNDGESCFIKYRTKHNNKVNQETFSYCNKK